jgi:hypothetical protein
MQGVKFAAEVNKIEVFITNVAAMNNTFSFRMHLISYVQQIQLMEIKNAFVMGHAMAYMDAVTSETCNSSKQI